MPLGVWSIPALERTRLRFQDLGSDALHLTTGPSALLTEHHSQSSLYYLDDIQGIVQTIDCGEVELVKSLLTAFAKYNI